MKRLFTCFSVLAIILLALSWTNSTNEKSANTKTIAVYNIDSILVKMPEYDSIVNVYMQYEKELNKEIGTVESEYQAKVNDFNRDSLKFSPIISQIKKAELRALHERSGEFRLAVAEELDARKHAWLLPLKEKIQVTASEIGKSNGYLAVIFTEGYIPIPVYNDVWSDVPVYTDSVDTYTDISEIKPVLVNQKLSNSITYLDPKIKRINITKEVALKMGCKP
jgi:Skp family chaperone for outer membrane proteins